MSLTLTAPCNIFDKLILYFLSDRYFVFLKSSLERNTNQCFKSFHQIVTGPGAISGVDTSLLFSIGLAHKLL